MSATDTCASIVRRGSEWSSRREPCGKPSKGALADGSPACGVHLRSEREATERRATREAWLERIASVKERLGISVGSWHAHQAVTVNLEDLERLADRLVPPDRTAS